MMMPAVIDTGIWFVAVSLRVPILLAAGALWYAKVCVRGFKKYNLVLNGSDCVDVFVVVWWFKIYIEQVQRVFCLSVADVCYVADCVAKVK